MKLSHDEVRHISQLARLGLSQSELDKFREQLSSILENFEILQQLDTSNIAPTTQAIPLHNVFREDEVAPSLPQSEVLANAPRREGDYFRVPPVFE
jgi:aspartyl-tRNA(Asn)/glutamyl-tRNA(Gln) amidotransferase subunit C